MYLQNNQTTTQPNLSASYGSMYCTISNQKEGLLYLYYLSLLHGLLWESLEWNKPKLHLTVKNHHCVRSSRPVRRNSNLPGNCSGLWNPIGVRAGRSRLYLFISGKMILSVGIFRRWRGRNICSVLEQGNGWIK